MADSVEEKGQSNGSIYEIPQQLLGGEDVPEEVGHALARACVVHCAAAAVNKEHAPSVDELKDFVVTHGAGSGSELYIEGAGWNIIGVSDLLRHEGYSVISQNLGYSPDQADLEKATQSGRVRNEFEKERLSVLSKYGGESRDSWIDAINDTVASGGKAIVSLRIPLLSGEGFGTHAVLVQDLDSQNEITYFDPDHYNVARFGEDRPNIDRIHESELIYRRPTSEFVEAMSGEVIHIYPPSQEG